MLPVSGRPSKGWRAEEAGGVLRQNAFVGLNMKLTRKAVPSLTVCSTSSSEWVMVLVRSGFGALAPWQQQNNDLASRERDWKGEVEEGERKENESLFLEGQ